MSHLSKIFTGLAILAMASPVSALTASQTIQKEVVEVAEDGTETVSYTSAELVVPGERIVYTVNFENNRDEAETNLVLTMPVPQEVNYLEGSASDAAGVLTFSMDGGNSFTDRSSLTVVSADGEATIAEPEDITHIRWVVAGPVNPGETGAISFKGILK